MAEQDRALDECLAALHDGRALQDVLRRHANRREELIGLLQLSLELGQLRPAAPSIAFRLRARNRMVGSAQRARSLRRAPLRIARRLRPAVIRVAGALAAVGIVFGGLSTAAAGTLPGAPLYALKTAMERIELRLTVDPANNTHLRLEFAQRRLDEAQRLAQMGRVSEAVRLVDLYTTALNGERLERGGAVGLQADAQLRQLAGTLRAAGNPQAAASVNQARTQLNQAMVTRPSQPAAQAQASATPAHPGPAGAAKQP